MEQSRVTIPPKGSSERAWAELLIAVYRTLRPLLRWMGRQQWVIAYAEWDERHVPKWFTIWNVMYVGVAAWGVVVTGMWLASL